jgi:hypothetical protein
MQRIGVHRGLLHGCLLFGACAVPVAGSAQQIEQGVAIVSEAIASRVDGFDYKPDSTSELDFRGTALSPRADGTARVRTGSNRTEISAKFTHMLRAVGGDAGRPGEQRRHRESRRRQGHAERDHAAL